MRQCLLGAGVVEIVSIPGVSLYPPSFYAGVKSKSLDISMLSRTERATGQLSA